MVVYNQRFLALKKQTTLSGFVTPDTYLKIAGETVTPNPNADAIPDGSTRTPSEIADPYWTIAGQITHHARPTTLPYFLHGLFGDPVTTGDGGTPVVAYKHVFTPLETVPCYSAYIVRDNLMRKLTGVLVKELALEATAGPGLGRILVVRPNVRAAIEAKDTGTVATPTFSTKKLFALATAKTTFKMDTVDKSIYIRAVKLTLDNGLDENAMHAFGSPYIQNIKVGEFKALGELTLDPFNITDTYDKMLAGAPFALEFMFESGETTGSVGGAAWADYYFKLELPKVHFLRDTLPHLSAREDKPITGPIEALYDSVTGYTAQATVVTTTPAAL